MRTALNPHFQRVYTLCLLGLFAAAAVGQQTITIPPTGVPTVQTQTPAAAAPAAAAPTAAPAAAQPAAAPAPVVPPKPIKQPIIHTLTFAPATHMVLVQSVVPTDWKDSVELMMSVWTPGFYRVENYSSNVQDFSARLLTGEKLTFEKSAENRWRINTQGDPAIVISYRLVCDRGSVSRSIVNEEYAVICGGPTYMTLVDELDRPHEVHLNMPTNWAKSAAGMPPASDSLAHHFLAKDFDTLMDSPIAAGNLQINSFAVGASRHHLVDIGNAADLVNWDGGQKIADLERMVQETRNFWGFLPFEDYYFLNKITRSGGGGLEHLTSTLIHTAPPARPNERPATRLRWLNFVTHEYFHTFNVKRLRPAELGPFDYEHARRTSGLWVAEGLTNYFNSLIVARAGLCTPEEYLGTLSGHIRNVQTTPGRLIQSLAASSLETWSGDGFGGNRGREVSISYYEKGPVVGFLLDAKIRRANNDKRSLDDVMRLAYSRYSLEKGYSEQEFLDTAQEVAGAGIDLKEFFDKNLFTPGDVDYTDALDWFGLRFAPSEGERPTWRLEVNPEATVEQKAHFASYLAPSQVPPPAVAATQPKPAEPVAAPPRTGPLVDGIGGIFILSNDPAKMAAWYEKCLGVQTARQQDGAFVFAFRYRRADEPNQATETLWAIIPSNQERVASPPQYLLNYRVPNMNQMLEHLKAVGIEKEKQEDYPHGRFVWLRDPDGNRVELFEKAAQ